MFCRTQCLSNPFAVDRTIIFGHIAWLTQGTPAHNALHCQVGLASGHSLGRDWRRRPGRPRARWTDQLRNDTGSVPANLWRQAILRGHGGAMRRPKLATRWWWRLTTTYNNFIVRCRIPNFRLWTMEYILLASHACNFLIYFFKSTTSFLFFITQVG